MPLPKLNLLPEQSGYTYNQAKDIVSVQLEGGLSKSRLDVLGAPAMVSVEWFLTLSEYQYFRAFYNSACNRGTSEFLIDLILDQPLPQEFTAKFVPDSVETTEPVGLSLRVSATLEVRPIDNTAIDEVVLLYYPDYSVLDLLETLVNTDLLVWPY